MNSPILCRDPWTNLFVGTYNDARTCCAGETILGDLNQQSLDDILNNDLAKNIRKDLASGVWPKNCSQCEQLESQGQRSYRNQIQEIDLLNQINNHPENYKIQTLDLRWNNTCTLACNYCSEKFSSSWSAIKKIDIATNRNYYQTALDWVSEHRESITKILLLGGEPLIIKENVKILEILQGRDIEIVVGTGLSVDLSTPVFERLKNFNKVSIDVSFENVGNRYEYVRHNASWDLLVKNIETVKKISGFHLCSLPIYNIYSATDLVKYHQFMLDYNFDRSHWHRIHWPNELDVVNHSTEVKQLALEELYQARDQFAHTRIYDHEFFNNLINILESSIDQQKLSNFEQFTHNIEKVYHPNKEHTFYELWPEFQGIIK